MYKKNSTQPRRIMRLATLLVSTIGSSTLQAGTVTGTIGSTITLETGCEVNTGTGTTGVDFGSLAFGTHSTLFNQADAEVLNASSAIAVLCSPGVTPTFTITGGVNDSNSGSANHAMANGAKYVPYSIYTDTGRSTVLTAGSAHTIPGTADGETAQTLELYGRAFGQAGLAVGTYVDTLSVQLDF